MTSRARHWAEEEPGWDIQWPERTRAAAGHRRWLKLHPNACFLLRRNSHQDEFAVSDMYTAGMLDEERKQILESADDGGPGESTSKHWKSTRLRYSISGRASRSLSRVCSISESSGSTVDVKGVGRCLLIEHRELRSTDLWKFGFPGGWSHDGPW
jgi:hypothetical protein